MKKEIVILIITHGNLAREFFNTTEMIAGKINNIVCFNFPKEMSFEKLEKKVKKYIQEHKKNDILIFTDLFGGTCFNICSKIIKRSNVKVFSGLNLGLLLEAIFLRNSLNLKDLAETLDSKKNETIIYVNKKLI